MGDAENITQQSKKRAAGRDISRDNPGLDDEEATHEEELGTFKRASEEVLASRRIVKVCRSQTTAASSAPSSNPFAALKLVPPPDSSGSNVVSNEAESLLSESEVKVDASSVIDGKSSAGETQLATEATESKVETNVDSKKHDGEELPNQPDGIDNKDAEVGKAKDEAINIVEPETVEKEVKKDAEVHTGEKEEPTDGNGKVEKTGEATPFSSFRQLSSSQNAFSGLVGTGLSGSSFAFGSLAKDGSPASSSGFLFGLKNDSYSFGFGFPPNGNAPLSGSSGVSIGGAKVEGTAFPSMQEVSIETGEENEKPVLTADSVLYEFLEGTWKERGKGELKVNVSSSGTGKARLIMRTRGNYRLVLNASLYPDMKLTNMDKKGITFACVNSAGEGKDGLSTFAVKFKEASMVDKFRSCVMEHKDEITVAPLKTPENSPKASDD